MDVIFAVVGLFAVCVGIVLIIVLPMEYMRRKKLTCKGCGSIYEEDEIEYRSIGSFGKDSKTTTSETHKDYVKVQFTFTCSECGKVKRFTKNFLVGYRRYDYQKGSYTKDEEYDLEKRVEDYVNLDFKEKVEKRRKKKAVKRAKKEIANAILSELKIADAKFTNTESNLTKNEINITSPYNSVDGEVLVSAIRGALVKMKDSELTKENYGNCLSLRRALINKFSEFSFETKEEKEFKALIEVVLLSVDEIYPFIAKYENIKEKITDPEIVKPVSEKINKIINSFDAVGEYADQFFDDEE